MKVLSVVGARPQFIKAAVVSRVLRTDPAVREVLLHTGQHYDTNMSDLFFSELDIPRPDYHLGIGGGAHGQNTGRMLEALEKVFVSEQPDWVLVYGDTDSTLAGALAAVKLHIPVAHVEAGLRSFNRGMPEEINRVLTDHASDLLFTPTQTAVENLRREGIPRERIHNVGDVMYDAALYYGTKAERKSRILERLDLQPKGYILATIHRAENTDDPERLENILRTLVCVHQDVTVVLPVHPRTRARAQTYKFDHLMEEIVTIDPVGYLDMVMLEKNARLIATDSGGVQKEAYFHRIPCVTLRDETEWVELVELGWNRLLPPMELNRLIDGLRDALRTIHKLPEHDPSLYGWGRAAELISRTLSAQR